jgi:hypothetical protein
MRLCGVAEMITAKDLGDVFKLIILCGGVAILLLLVANLTLWIYTHGSLLASPPPLDWCLLKWGGC